jgi:hypothetical protein
MEPQLRHVPARQGVFGAEEVPELPGRLRRLCTGQAVAPRRAGQDLPASMVWTQIPKPPGDLRHHGNAITMTVWAATLNALIVPPGLGGNDHGWIRSQFGVQAFEKPVGMAGFESATSLTPRNVFRRPWPALTSAPRRSKGRVGERFEAGQSTSEQNALPPSRSAQPRPLLPCSASDAGLSTAAIAPAAAAGLLPAPGPAGPP